MMNSMRISRSAVVRLTRQARPQTRTFIKPTAVRQADLVQDLYLRELKSFKPAPIKPSDSEGHVHVFSAPKAPRSPEEGNIADELKAYEDQKVEVEGQAAGTEEGGSVQEDWFEDEEGWEDEEHGLGDKHAPAGATH